MIEGLSITGITLTPDACSDILETAVGAGYTYGFGYWAALTSVKKRAGGRYAALTLHEHEGADGRPRLTVTPTKLRAAVLAMLRYPERCHCRGLVRQLLDDDGLDGPLAEAIIQVACFGEVV